MPAPIGGHGHRGLDEKDAAEIERRKAEVRASSGPRRDAMLRAKVEQLSRTAFQPKGKDAPADSVSPSREPRNR